MNLLPFFGLVTLGVARIFAQASDPPAWLNLASTTGLGLALGWFVWQLSRGELITKRSREREDKLIEALTETQGMNVSLAEIVKENQAREDRLMSYLEARAEKGS